MNVCYEALPSRPRCPHLSVTRDLQYFKNSVFSVQTWADHNHFSSIWIYVFYIYIFKTYQQTHMATLSLKFQRTMPLLHKILSYTYINHFLQNWIFHFHEILLWWEEKLLLNIFSNVFTKFWRSTRVLHWNWINEQEIRCHHRLRQAPSWTTYVTAQGSIHCILHLFVFRRLSEEAYATLCSV